MQMITINRFTKADKTNSRGSQSCQFQTAELEDRKELSKPNPPPPNSNRQIVAG